MLADRVLTREPILLGAEHLFAIAEKPSIILANHLSYSDANLLDVLIQRGERRRWRID